MDKLTPKEQMNNAFFVEELERFIVWMQGGVKAGISAELFLVNAPNTVELYLIYLDDMFSGQSLEEPH